MGKNITQFPDTAEKSRKQLDAIEEIITQIPDSTEMCQILSKYCDTACDYCNEQISTLQIAQKHYHSEHGTDGYIKCCDLKLDTDDKTNGHILYHLYPEHFT